MEWVLIIPVFLKLIDVVDQRSLYLILMNLFIPLCIIWVVILYSGKGIKIDQKRFGIKLKENVIISISAIILLIWAFLLSDFFFYIRENQVSPILDTIAKSLYCFGFFYCVFGPLLFGICLSVLVQAIVAGIKEVFHNGHSTDIQHR